MKRFINWITTEETEETPVLDKIMLVGAIIEIAIFLLFIVFLIRLASWGMII